MSDSNTLSFKKTFQTTLEIRCDLILHKEGKSGKRGRVNIFLPNDSYKFLTESDKKDLADSVAWELCQKNGWEITTLATRFEDLGGDNFHNESLRLYYYYNEDAAERLSWLKENTLQVGRHTH